VANVLLLNPPGRGRAHFIVGGAALFGNACGAAKVTIDLERGRVIEEIRQGEPGEERPHVLDRAISIAETSP